MANRPATRIATACFALALVLRLGILFGTGLYHKIDRTEMASVAVTFARTGQIANAYMAMPTGPTAHVAPGYPIVMGLVFRVFGDGRTGETAKQVLACIVSSARSGLLVFLVLAFGLGEGTALTAGLLSAVYIGAVETELRGDWEGPFAGDLLLLLVLWGYWLAWGKIPRPRAGAIYGIAWGIALLVSPSLMPVAAGLVVLAALAVARKSPRGFAMSVGCFAAGCLLALTPWIVRNYLVLGGFVWGRSNLGLELSLSNGPGANWSNPGNQKRIFSMHPSRYRPATEKLLSQGELAFHADRKREAMEWISTHRSEFMSLTWQRIVHFWFPPGRNPVHQGAVSLLTLLAFAGLLLLAKMESPAFWITAVVWTTYPLTYYIIQWSSRYRQPMDWSMVLAAGVAIHLAVVRVFSLRQPRKQRGYAGENARATVSRTEIVIVLALIALGVWRISRTYPVFNQTYDEPLHVACGLELLSKGTYTFEYQHPPLARILEALGPYLKGIRPLPIQERWDQGNAVLLAGNDYWTNLTLARIGNLPFYILACVVVYLWGRRWFGRPVALIGTAVFSMLPPVLAHAGFATTDMACCASVALASYCLLLWAEEPSWKRALGVGVAFAVVVLSKMSAPFYAIGCGGAIAVASYVARAQDWNELRRQAAFRARQLIVILPLTLVLIWAGYGFSVATLASSDRFEKAASRAPALRTIAHVPLPLTELFLGVASLMNTNSHGHDSYLLGSYSSQGWWYFFLVVLAVKTPLGVLVLCLLSLALARRWIDDRRRFAQLATLLCAGAVLAIAMSARINLGVRHILPIYPFVAILAAQGIVFLLRDRRPKWIAAAVVLLLGLDLFHTSAAGIDQVAYFNPLAGSHPERILSESDLDWGQDLHRLSLRLHELGVPRVSLAYFGTAPLETAGLPEFEPLDPAAAASGYVAISVHHLTLSAARDGSYKWLAQWTPLERVGKSIYIYKLGPYFAGKPTHAQSPVHLRHTP